MIIIEIPMQHLKVSYNKQQTDNRTLNGPTINKLNEPNMLIEQMCSNGIN